MDGGSQICDGPTSRQPAGQPNLEKMAAGRGPPGGPGRHWIVFTYYFLKFLDNFGLCGGLRPEYICNHVRVT